jgi:hypothetical protein
MLLNLLRELGCSGSRIEFLFVGKMPACEFKITPQSTRTTRIQRRPENHPAHLKNRHLSPGNVSMPGAQEKRVLGQLRKKF